MINEVFDDDVDDSEVEPEVVAKGDFKRTLAGREIWFNSPLPGQFNAWKRYRESLKRRFDVIKVQAKKNSDMASYRELSELSEKFDISTLEFVESLLVDEADVDFIAMEMISGRVTTVDIQNVLFTDEEPEDDAEPEVKAKAPKKITASKAAANAKRTRK